MCLIHQHQPLALGVQRGQRLLQVPLQISINDLRAAFQVWTEVSGLMMPLKTRPLALAPSAGSAVIASERKKKTVSVGA